MHSLTYLVAGCLFSFIAFGTVTKKEVSGKIHWDITVDGFTKTEVEINGKKFIKTTLEGVGPHAGVLLQEGRPELAVIRLYVRGEGDISIVPSPREFSPLDSHLQPLIAGKSVRKRRGERRMIPELVSRNLDDERRLLNDYEIKAAGVWRGIPERLITLYPIQIDIETGVESYVRHFHLEVPNAPLSQESETVHGIVYPKKMRLAKSLNAWIEEKKTRGVNTLIHYSQDETPAQIRAVLQSWYKSHPGLKFVLLLGDVDVIPAFPSSKIEGMTDHYYAALDGEYEADLMAPDIQVGRLPLSNAKLVGAYFKRVMEYNHLSVEETPWLRKSSLIATDDPDFWKLTESSLLQVIEKHLIPRTFEGSFPLKPTKGGDQLFAFTQKANHQNLLEAFQDGRSVIVYSGHGQPQEWEKPALKNTEVEALSLKDSIPFVFGFSCQTGRFSEASIAEAWVQKANGAISSVGSYADTYWDEDFILQEAVLEELFEHNEPVGTAMHNGLKELWRYFGGLNFSDYYWETYHLFSDPSLKFRISSSQ